MITRIASNCRGLTSDLAVLLEDFKLIRQGWTLHYAVDFTEIYSFVEGGDLWQLMRVFDDEPQSTTEAADRFVMEQLLLGSEPAILLSPYALELESTTRRIAADEARKMIAETAQAHRELAALVESEEFKEHRGRLDALTATPTADQADAIGSLMTYIEQHAATLYRLANPRETPLQRLHRLLVYGQLKPLAHLGFSETNLRVDYGRVGQTTEDLRGTRRVSTYASNYLDALALEIIEAANMRLAPRRERLLFITRAKSLHRLAEKNRAKGNRWDLLRHPRLYRAKYVPHSDGARIRSLEDLEAIEAAMSTFVDGFDRYGSTQEAIVVHYLEELQAYWNAQGDLGALRHKPRCDLSRKEQDPNLGALQDFLSKLTTGLDAAIVSRIDELGRQIREITDLLSFAVQMPQGLPIDALGVLRSLVFRVPTDATTTALPALPYQLTLDPERLPAGVGALVRGEAASWGVVLAVFRDSLHAPDGYPVLLLFAYVLGQWRRWEAALYFAERAVAAGTREGDDAVDGYLLLAHYLRKRAQASAADWQRAFDLLTLAADRARSEPRLAVERVALLLHWHARLRLAPTAFASPPIPLGDVLNGVADADVACDKNDALRAQLHNHVCYFYASSPADLGPEDREVAGRALTRLLEAQRFVTPERAKWPPNVRDTTVWARWRLESSYLSALDLTGLIQELAKVLDLLPSEDQDAAVVRSHQAVLTDARRMLEGSPRSNRSQTPIAE